MKYPPHRPLHRINEKGIYMLTAATYQKELYFNTSERLNFLQDSLLNLAEEYGWKLQSWAVLANHYHFVAESPDNSKNLPEFLSHLHGITAKYINAEDNTPNRRVWWQYWDSRITHHYSYLARLNYVNKNPVKHGLVDDAIKYPWCSASWFKRNTPQPFFKMVDTSKIDTVNVIDDF